MANKLRPSGSYKDILNLTANDLAAMGESQLRAIVNKLNDVANKRITRIEKAGKTHISQAYIQRKGSRLTTKNIKVPIVNPFGEQPISEEDLARALRGERVKGVRTISVKAQLMGAYREAKAFLTEIRSASLRGVREYEKEQASILDKVRRRAMENPENLDKRYKEPRLRRKAETEALTDFWTEYNRWKERNKSSNPDKWKDGSPKNSVAEFYDEYYDSGDYEEEAEEEYEENEEPSEPLEEGEDDESEYIQPSASKRGGKKGTKQTKQQGWKPKIRFQKVKIF